MKDSRGKERKAGLRARVHSSAKTLCNVCLRGTVSRRRITNRSPDRQNRYVSFPTDLEIGRSVAHRDTVPRKQDFDIEVEVAMPIAIAIYH